MAENTQVATQKKSEVANRGWGEVIGERLDSMKEALPKDFNQARFIQNSIALLTDNPQLKDANGNEVLAGLIKGAILGVDFLNKECYLVPYGNKLQFQLDYKGAKKLAKKYSVRPIKGFHADVVRKGDEFSSEIIDNKPRVTFKPLPFNNSEIIGAFAYAEFEDGGIVVDTMSLEELENTRSKSKMGKSGAWKDFTSQMYIKTVIRRLMKQIEVDFENPNQRQIYDADEAVVQTPEDVIETVAVEVEENANAIPFSIEDNIEKK